MKKYIRYAALPLLLLMLVGSSIQSMLQIADDPQQIASAEVLSHVEQMRTAMDLWFDQYTKMSSAFPGLTGLDEEMNRPGRIEDKTIVARLHQFRKSVPGMQSIKLVSVDSINGAWLPGESQIIADPPVNTDTIQVSQQSRERLETLVRLSGLGQWYKNDENWFEEGQKESLTIGRKIINGDDHSPAWILLMDLSINDWSLSLHPFLTDATVETMVYTNQGVAVNALNDGSVIAYSKFFLDKFGQHATWTQTVNGKNSVIVSRTTIAAPWTIVGFSVLPEQALLNPWSILTLILLVAVCILSILEMLSRKKERLSALEKNEQFEQLLQTFNKLKEDIKIRSDREGATRDETEKMLMQRDQWYRQVQSLEKQLNSYQQQQHAGTLIWKNALARSRTLLQEVLDVLMDHQTKKSERWAANELLHLMDQLELYFMLSNHQVVLLTGSLDLRELINEAWDESALRHGGNTIGLRNEASSVLPHISGDENRLRYLFSYLFSQFMLVSKRGQLVVEAELSGSWMTILFKESGLGIDPKQWEALFGGKEMNRSLGAAIANQIILLHGGTARVESNERLGSAFVFTLPVSLIKQANELHIN